jgi:sigma-B regulation protein RsbU (phosphoserine phosphatase)
MAVLFRSYVRGRKLEHELAIARGVQQSLLPRAHELPATVALAGAYQPAAAVGGDYYDVFSTDTDGTAVVVGDVSGKGMPAALLMGVVHGAVRSSDWHRSTRSHVDCTQRLNRLLCERAATEQYTSMFWAYCNAEGDRLHYVNAGHCSPVLVRGSDVIALNTGGPVLGLLPGARYEQEQIRLHSSDVLVLYSDGLIEANDASGEEFGYERLVEALVRSQDRSPEGLRRSVGAALKDFAGAAPLNDDFTLVVMQFGAARAEASIAIQEPALAI